MTDRERIWKELGERNGWEMPETYPWKRLPIIRHIRALILAERVRQWYTHGPGSIGIPSGEDQWIVHGIWMGKEKV